MDDVQTRKIAAIIYSYNEKNQELLNSLKTLRVPDGYAFEIINVSDESSQAAAYQKGMMSSKAKYKIYMDGKISVLYKSFLYKILRTFQADENIGIIGLSGSEQISLQGISLLSNTRVGKMKLFNGKQKVWRELDGAYRSVQAVDGYFIATQYDIPWRADSFSKDCFWDTAQCFEFIARGYKVVVIKQNSFWLCYNVSSFVYDQESQNNFFEEYAQYLLTQGMIERSFKDRKLQIKELMLQQRYEEALSVIVSVANKFYEYNQTCKDDDLESMLLKIEKKISSKYISAEIHESSNRNIVFYDGFGMDLRGLARIYLKALGELGYHITYIVKETAKGHIPMIENILVKFNAEVYYISQTIFIKKYQEVCFAICQAKAGIAFLYTTPDDVSGIMAFEHFVGKIKRYQINLTDHAFWLGRYAFDYCIEFRDYGASVSFAYREIPNKKLVKLPFYPIIEENQKFEGFPFKKNKGDFVIFSGGALYKTIERKNIYYQIVEFCLDLVPTIKFWYAGTGDDARLKKLMRKYPGRVFHTEERDDLYPTLKQVDMYLSTYPISGGLMTQYSALAGRVPLTLRMATNPSLDDTSGMLLVEDSVFVFDTVVALEKEIEKMVSDKYYRSKRENMMIDSVIDARNFKFNLLQIMENNSSDYSVQIYNLDMRDSRRIYAERYAGTYLRRMSLFGKKENLTYIELGLQIRKMLRESVLCGKKEFIIYPYGLNGILVQNILNNEFKLKEKLIIDNRVCMFNKAVKPINVLKEMDAAPYTVLVTSRALIN